MKDIRFKRKKWPLFLGIALMVVLTPLLCTLVYFLFLPEIELVGKVIAVIVGGMFFLIPFYGAILSIKSYFDNGKRIREGLEKYGEENLMKNIQDNTISVYMNPLDVSKNGVYFTDKLIIDPGKSIIDYNEISLMYKHVARNSNSGVVISSIDFELLDGSSLFLCNCIEDKQIHEYMQLCYQHNPQILIGYTEENLKRHKERVVRYKKGEIVIPELKL